MPFIHTKVNRPIPQETEKKLSRQLGQAISLLPGKNENWLMLQFEENCRLYFKGSDENPLAFVNVKLFGASSEAAYQKLTAEITRILKTELHIAPENIYVQYDEIDHWGWNGANF
ncbi:MAG: hypothetical protein E7324_09440 [Clostridiales bacterium]|nr:hypothetical protein [Clostridiales bacterium]